MISKFNKLYFLLLTCVFLLAQVSYGQDFKNGIRTGVINVKLKPEIVGAQSSLKSSSKSGTVSIGIEKFDHLNKQTKATNMTRLFPYSEKHEEKHRRHGLHLWYQLEVDPDTDIKSAISQYKALAEIDIAEGEYQKAIIPVKKTKSFTQEEASLKATTEDVFNDPLLQNQWHYINTGQHGGTVGADINIEEVWKEIGGASNVVVAVHDVGIEYTHEDLVNAMWVNEAELNGERGMDDDGNGYVDDIYGYNFGDGVGEIVPGFHGTHVAGTIGATNNNGIGVCGVAGGTGNNDGVKMMSMDIFGASGGGNTTAASYIYAADNGAVISQNSWGYVNPEYYEQSVHDGIDYFIAEAGYYTGSPMRGGIVIFASGNDGSGEPYYPGAYENVMDVSALDNKNQLAHYSNYGEWVDITAPGGAQDVNYLEGVLSCDLDNDYTYLHGTSMACPHVSGLAALIVAKYQGADFTNEDLERRLITGTKDVYDIEYNTDYIGKMGIGTIDAFSSMKANDGIAPEQIIDLIVSNIAQDYAVLDWTVPADEDDVKPYEIELYYSTIPFTDANLVDAIKITLPINKAVGETMQYELSDLSALTTYYFAVRALDRWDNAAPLSEVLSASTNSGPTVVVNPESLSLLLDVTQSHTTSAQFTISNTGEGDLRWTATPRHSSNIDTYSSTTTNTNQLVFPSQYNISTFDAERPAIIPYAQVEKEDWMYYDERPYMIYLGETDLNLSNSSATRFMAPIPDNLTSEDNQLDGFNLTHVELGINFYDETGETKIPFQVYEGPFINSARLVYEDEFTPNKENSSFYNIQLKDQLYFEPGTYFWVVMHVPAGPVNPLIGGKELNNSNSLSCYYSSNMGQSWVLFEELVSSTDIVWLTAVGSLLEPLEQYITLTPDNGDVVSNDANEVSMEIVGTELINGDYKSSITLFTNETDKELQRVDVEFTVSGHLPKIETVNVVDYQSVFIGLSKSFNIEVANTGYGPFVSDGDALTVTFSNPQFSLDQAATDKIPALTSTSLAIRYTPTTVGAANCLVSLSDKNGNTHSFNMYGVGIDPPKAEITPLESFHNNLNLGDVVEGSFLLTNIGDYPLTYYVPKFGDASILSDEAINEYTHKYGYSAQIKEGNSSNPSFEWTDISSTGTDVMQQFIDDSDLDYIQLELGFNFDFFGQREDSIYIARRSGLLTFDTKFRFNTSSVFYNRSDNNDRYISASGNPFSVDPADAPLGQIYYQSFPDSFVVQYQDIVTSYRDEITGTVFNDHITYQIIVWDSGDIKILFKDLGNTNAETFGINNMLIAIEDRTLEDGLFLAGTFDPYNKIDYEPTKTPPLAGFSYQFNSPGVGAVSEVSNTQGVVAAGQSVTIDYTIDTDSLYVNDWKERIGIASDDPENGTLYHTAYLNIVSGGIPDIALSEDTIDFGSVFQGGSKEITVRLKNTGRAISTIQTATASNGFYTVDGYLPAKLNPESIVSYTISINSEQLGDHNDRITFTDDWGTNLELIVTGEVVEAPIIGSDPIEYNETLNVSEQTTRSLTVSNTGLNPMELTVAGTEWLKIYEPNNHVLSNDFDYTLIINEDKEALEHNWININQSENRIPFEDEWFEDEKFWVPVEMPFTFNFYGQEYDTLYVGHSGLVSFTGGQGAHIFGGFERVPDPNPETVTNYIAPFHGFIQSANPEWYPNSGHYMIMDDEKITIQYAHMLNIFGSGEPISMQLILYKNGLIKMMYQKWDPDFDWTTTYGITALENFDATKGLEIAYRKKFIQDGMTLTLAPTQKYSIPASSSKVFDVVFDASTLMGGDYNGAVQLKNNTPAAPDYEIPASLSIIGEQSYDVIKTIEFDSLMLVPTETAYMAYDSVFTFTNNGTQNMLLKGLRLKEEALDGAKIYGDDLTFGDGASEDGWYDVSLSLLNHTLKPGQSQDFKLEVNPSEVGKKSGYILLYTDLSSTPDTIHVNVEYFHGPQITTGGDELYVYANTDDEIQNKTLLIENIEGASALHYSFSMEYFRETSSSASTRSAQSSNDGGLKSSTLANESLQNIVLEAPSGSKLKSGTADPDFNRVLAYTTKDVADNAIGFNGADHFRSATKFVAPEDGFNLTHIQTHYAWGDVTNSTISVQILSGTDDIHTGEVLYSQEFVHQAAEASQIGGLITIKLNKEMTFFPNEAFYIVLIYSDEVAFPLGLTREETIRTGISYYGNNDAYYDLAATTGYENAVNLVKACEEYYKVAGWADFGVPFNGSITTGGSLSIPVTFNPAMADQGINKAILSIASNDPVNPLVNVNLQLDKNRGPQFVGGNELNLEMAEGDTLEHTLSAIDPEGDDFTYTLVDGPDFLKAENVDTHFKLTFTPDYEASGEYYAEVEATDANGHTSLVAIYFLVRHMNRAPIMVHPIDEQFLILESDTEFEIDLAEYISDPDGDVVTFTAGNNKPQYLDLFQLGSTILLAPKDLGTATIIISANDGLFGTSNFQFKVNVVHRTGIDELNGGEIEIYPNPVESILHVRIGHDINTVENISIRNINGQLIDIEQAIDGTNNEITLNVSTLSPGVYVLLIGSEEGSHVSKFIKK